MISFSEYQNSVPRVLFSVGRSIMETLQIESQHFLGLPKNVPPTKAIMPGIYHDPETDGYVHYKNDGTTLKLKSLDSAEMFAETLKRSHNKTLQALDKKLTSHYADATTSPMYIKHLDQYSTDSSKINHALLHASPLTDEQSHHVMTLDDIVSHTRTPDDMVLYSGVSRSHGNEMLRKDVVHHPSFISTSLTVNKAMDFASRGNGDLVEIHVPANHKGVYIDHVSDYSEREFLLPRGLNFRIHKDKEKVLITPSRQFRVHHATIET